MLHYFRSFKTPKLALDFIGRMKISVRERERERGERGEERGKEREREGKGERKMR